MNVWGYRFFKNSNKASWLLAALENEKNEAVSGESRGQWSDAGPSEAKHQGSFP